MERGIGEVLTTVIPIMAVSLLAIVFFLFLILQVRGRYMRRAVRVPDEGLETVDLEAFRNLTDPSEEAFLRQRLTPAEFRKVQRVRLRAATLYVSALSENVGALLQLAQ